VKFKICILKVICTSKIKKVNILEWNRVTHDYDVIIDSKIIEIVHAISVYIYIYIYIYMYGSRLD